MGAAVKATPNEGEEEPGEGVDGAAEEGVAPITASACSLRRTGDDADRSRWQLAGQ
jgi:hypothetical protein